MATHFGILAWEIPWTEEPGRLQSSGSQRVGHNCSTEQQQCIQNNCTLTYKHSLVAQMVKNLPAMQEAWVNPWVAALSLNASAGDAGLIPGSGRSPGEGNGNPLQYSCLENPVDRGA